MRVALLTNFVPPYRVPVFRALRDRVDELRIFVSTAMESNRTWKPDWADLDVRVQNTWTWRRTWKHERFTEGYDLHVPYDTVPRLMNWRPDVIISAEFGLRSAQAIAYANMARVPIIIWATLADHLERSRGAIRAFARRGMIHAIDRVIVNGESGARYIRSIGGNEDMIVRIPQAIDVQMFTSLPIARDPAAARRLLFCGAVSQLKGFDLVMEGLELWAHRFPQERISLAVVGTGPLLDTSKKRPRPAKVAIEWIGAVPYSSLPACYARAGILLFPTRGDEWGLVVNEAMAAGLPVIGSEYSQAADELVEDGVNGWRFRADDADAVAATIARAMETPDQQLAAMRDAARATALRITPENVADRIEAVLREVEG